MYNEILVDALAIYACDSFGDDTDGDLIWARNDPDYDLTKGDGVTAATFPTLVESTEHHTAWYVFDGVDDYVSDWLIPSGSWVSAAMSTAYPDGQPYIVEGTGDTVKNLLTFSGAFTGNLHNLVVFAAAAEPSSADKVTIGDYQLRRAWRDEYVDPYTARLIRNEECVQAYDFEHPEDLYNDYAGVSTSTPSDLSWDEGLKFDISTSSLTAAHSSELALPNAVSMFFACDFTGPGSGPWPVMEKGSEYYMLLLLSGDNMTLYVNGKSSPSVSRSAYTVAAVVEDGENPLFYVDGELVGDGSPVTLSTGTDDLLFGASIIPGLQQFQGTMYRASVFNKALTPEEIRLLHYSARLGRANNTEIVRATITDVDGDDEITSSQTDVILTCTNAGASTGRVLLTDEAVFSESTIVVEQSVDSWSDTSIQFDVVPGAL